MVHDVYFFSAANASKQARMFVFGKHSVQSNLIFPSKARAGPREYLSDAPGLDRKKSWVCTIKLPMVTIPSLVCFSPPITSILV
jgi:hypothetical protein